MNKKYNIDEEIKKIAKEYTNDNDAEELLRLKLFVLTTKAEWNILVNQTK